MDVNFGLYLDLPGIPKETDVDSYHQGLGICLHKANILKRKKCGSGTGTIEVVVGPWQTTREMYRKEKSEHTQANLREMHRMEKAECTQWGGKRYIFGPRAQTVVYSKGSM